MRVDSKHCSLICSRVCVDWPLSCSLTEEAEVSAAVIAGAVPGVGVAATVVPVVLLPTSDAEGEPTL